MAAHILVVVWLFSVVANSEPTELNHSNSKYRAIESSSNLGCDSRQVSCPGSFGTVCCPSDTPCCGSDNYCYEYTCGDQCQDLPCPPPPAPPPAPPAPSPPEPPGPSSCCAEECSPQCVESGQCSAGGDQCICGPCPDPNPMPPGPGGSVWTQDSAILCLIGAGVLLILLVCCYVCNNFSKQDTDTITISDTAEVTLVNSGVQHQAALRNSAQVASSIESITGTHCSSCNGPVCDPASFCIHCGCNLRIWRPTPASHNTRDSQGG